MKEYPKLEQKKQMLDDNFSKAFDELQKIAAILSEMGLNIREYVYDENPITGIKGDWERGTGIGLVSDGLDGIRATRNKDCNGFKIWFTNGFEDQDNPQRKEITKKLKEAGFEVN